MTQHNDRIKYIMLDVDGDPMPILFPGLLTHHDVAKGFPQKVISAGFVQIRWDRSVDEAWAEVSGKSTGLGVESRPEEDALIITRIL